MKLVFITKSYGSFCFSDGANSINLDTSIVFFKENYEISLCFKQNYEMNLSFKTRYLKSLLV